MTLDRLIAARALALFASDLSTRCRPCEAAVTSAIRNAVRAHCGVCGCAGEVGAAYGEHPETAAARMRWARGVIESIYAPAAASWGGLEATGRSTTEISGEYRGFSGAPRPGQAQLLRHLDAASN